MGKAAVGINLTEPERRDLRELLVRQPKLVHRLLPQKPSITPAPSALLLWVPTLDQISDAEDEGAGRLA
jgi:hypothetical protein